ncbi:unnamed protein product [Miscanthus lutarioriparius]|uniref:Uncharacterized protein n=1 Tax=Miscanthus lutarioriparius TaxID=422564 RepID=A0A811R286_9POAL|nr:unnamed protein product [Miscanthus lutarioriparius]
MARLAPLSLLLFSLVIITSSDEVLSSSEVDGGGPAADAVVCDTIFDICVGSCWKSGKCMRCCKHHGFVHGKCSLKDGDGCYCCHTPDQK